MAILLPDILDNNALPENFEASVTREKLLKFQEYLSKFDEAELTKDFNSTQQVHSLYHGANVQICLFVIEKYSNENCEQYVGIC